MVFVLPIFRGYPIWCESELTVSQTEIISKLSKYFLKSHWCSTGHLLSAETASVLCGLSARFLSGFLGLRKTNKRREWAAAGCPKVTLSPRVSQTSTAERRRSHTRKQYLYLFVCKRLHTHACTPTEWECLLSESFMSILFGNLHDVTCWLRWHL